MGTALFPVQKSVVEDLRRQGIDALDSLPLAMVQPHNAQALRNHGKTVEELQREGGLSPWDLVFLLHDMQASVPPGPGSQESASGELKLMLNTWMLERPRPRPQEPFVNKPKPGAPSGKSGGSSSSASSPAGSKASKTSP